MTSKNTLKGTDWIITTLFSKDRLDSLPTFDRLRFITMVSIVWSGALILLLVAVIYGLYEQYDQSFYTLIVMLLYIPMLPLLYYYQVRPAALTLLGTFYVNTVWAMALRLKDCVDGHLELNFILIGLFCIFLLKAGETLYIILFLAANYIVARLLVFHYLQQPIEIGQLLNGGALFIALIYFGYTIKNVSLRIQQSIEAQNKNLAELNSVKDTLFSIIGHDLRSPIAGLKMQINALQAGYTSPVQFGQRTEQLVQTIDGVYYTLDNLLQWALLQRNRIKATPSKLDLSVVTQSVLTLYLADIEHKRLTVKTYLDPAEAVVDEHQLGIVVRNLLNNAVKFTPQGGTILITTNTRNNRALLTIQDSGVGMPTHLIAPKDGLRESQHGTDGEKGTGLGLDLCQEFVKLNHGKLHIQSVAGKGATFTVDFASV
ncbi:sensor histidine kinase [Fibrella aquatica]|uniref:sensor histidine kinase n=1 Tax=Fibrella aquatica TaxID=3242487 RepID=UPI0035211D8D